MNNGWLSSSEPIGAHFDALFVDLDGVVYLGERAVPHAALALTAAATGGMSVLFVTNNASRTAASVAEQLRSLGVPSSAAAVLTSAQATASFLAGQVPPQTPVLVVGSAALATAIGDAGLRPVADLSERPQVIVQGFSPTMDWAQLAQACAAVRSGIRWVATNTDLTLPTPHGPAPGNGAFVQLVSSVTGVSPEVIGKPELPMLQAAKERTAARSPLMIGDRLDTDIQGAVTAGVAGMLVFTGVHAVHDLLRAPTHQRPQLVGGDLRDLELPVLAPQEVSDGWAQPELGLSCRWRNSAWEVFAPEPQGQTATDRLRALALIRVCCSAIWGAADPQARDHVTALSQAMAPWTGPWGWDR